MKPMPRNFRQLGLAALTGLCLIAARSAQADPSPGNPPQGPQAAASMPAPKSSADPMAEYQRLGKLNTFKPGPSPVAHQAIAAPAASGRSHLHCVFRIKPDGSYRLVRAVQVEGDPLVSDEAAGPIIAEVSKGDEVVSVQGHIDPFEKRSFAGKPGSGLEGHHFGSEDEAEVIVKIPNASLADADLDKLSVRLYRWQGDEGLRKVDKESMREYKRLNRVRGLSDIPGDFLKDEIRAKGMHAPK